MGILHRADLPVVMDTLHRADLSAVVDSLHVVVGILIPDVIFKVNLCRANLVNLVMYQTVRVSLRLTVYPHHHQYDRKIPTFEPPRTCNIPLTMAVEVK